LLEQDLSGEKDSDDSIKTDFNLRSGLHAKIYILEEKSKNQLYLYNGSANATHAAFNGNLEFLVGLRKSNPEITIADLIEPPEQSQIKFSSILSPYIPSSDIEDPDEDPLEAEMRELKREFLNLDLYLEVEEKNISGERLYDLYIKLRDGKLNIFKEEKGDLEIICWPVTLKKENHFKRISDLNTKELLFSSLSINSLTSFIAFEIKINNQKRTSFVLNLTFIEEPEKRKERILTSIITNQNQFIKFLYLLLQDKDQLIFSPHNTFFRSKGAFNKKSKFLSLPLMEDMLQALSNNVEIIDRIERIVKNLEASEQKRIPDEFYNIWEAIVEVRREEIERY
ncbi:MAG: hypothetical protein ACOCRX_09260, partial [Candidatus Woesearchaeota archaeon]